MRRSIGHSLCIALSLVWAGYIRAGQAEPATISIHVDAGKILRKVPNQLWGTAFYSSEKDRSWGVSVARWGGNASTPYNWVIGAWNEGITNGCQNTYYGNSKEGGKLLRGALDVDFKPENIGAEFLLTVPIIGWAPKDGSTGRPGWGPGDLWIQNVPYGPDFMVQWLLMLKARGQLPAFISLDNEPDYWASVHQNVCPREVTSKEMADNLIRYGGAIKEAIPEAVIIGPISTNISSAFGGAEARDHESRGGLKHLEYVLKRCADHEKACGVRVLDYIGYQSYSSGSVNSAYQVVTELRQLRAWVDQQYPGTKIAQTEYSWHINTPPKFSGSAECGLAYALGFGLMIREGMDLACVWTKPNPQSPPAMGFKIYRNYDDHGGKFDGCAIASESSEPKCVDAFAALSADGSVLRIIAINQKPAQDAVVTFDVAGFQARKFDRIDYGAQNPNALVPGSGESIDGSTFKVRIPAFSMCLLLLPNSAATVVRPDTKFDKPAPRAATRNAVAKTNATVPVTTDPGDAIPLGADGSVRSFWILGPFHPIDADDFGKDGKARITTIDPDVKALSEVDVAKDGEPLGWEQIALQPGKLPDDAIQGQRDEYLRSLSKDQKITDAALTGGDGVLTSVLIGRHRGSPEAAYLKPAPVALAWERVLSPGPLFDFNAHLGVRESASRMAYLYSEIVCARDTENITLALEADDQAAVYLNGQLAVKKDAPQMSPAPIYSAPLKLNAGKNRLLIRSTNQNGDWVAGVKFVDEKHAPLADLSIPGPPSADPTQPVWTDLSGALNLDNPLRAARNIVGALYVDSPRGVAYAGVNHAGLWRSADDGKTWTQASAGEGGHALEASLPAQIWIDPEGPEAKNLIVGCVYGTAGLFASYDAGKSWQTIADFPVTSFAVDPADAQRKTLLASRQWARGVWLTKDGGKTWTDVARDLPERGPNRDQPNWVWGVALLDSQTFLAACGDFQGSAGNGIWRTQDGGATWAQVCKLNVMGSPQILGDTILWGGRGQHIVSSTDAGRTWQPACVPDAAFGGTLAAAPAGQWSYYAAFPKLYQSSDGGRAWLPARMPAVGRSAWGLPHGAWGLGAVALDSKRGYIYLGADDRGLFRAKLPPVSAPAAHKIPDGMKFLPVESPGEVLAWRVLAPIQHRQPSVERAMLFDEHGIEASVFTGAPKKFDDADWTTLDAMNGGVDFAAKFPCGQEVYAYSLTYIELDRDAAVSVELAFNSMARLWLDGTLIFERFTSAGGASSNGPVVNLSKGVHALLLKAGKSKDTWNFTLKLKDLETGKPLSFKSWPEEAPRQKGDPIWTDISGNLPLSFSSEKGPQQREACCVAFSAQNPQTIFTALTAGGGIWVTHNAGKTWEKVSGPQLDAGNPHKLWVDPADDSQIMLSGFGSLLRSHDGGKTFESIKNGRVEPFWVDQNDPERKTILVGFHESGDIHRTADGGKTWNSIAVKNNGGGFAQAFYVLNAQTHFAAFDQYGGFKGDLGFWRTDDGGATWKAIGVTLKDGDKEIEKKFHCATGVCVTADGKVYVGGTGPDLMVIENGGKDIHGYRRSGWTMIAPEPAAFSEGFVYIADGFKMLISTDGGKSWRTGKGKDKSGRGCLMADDKRKRLYFAAGKLGVFSAQIEGIGIKE